MLKALRNKSVAATILVIVVVASALVIVCSDGIHAGTVESFGDACAVMAHSSAMSVAALSSAGAGSATLLVAVAGLAMFLLAVRPPAAIALADRRVGPPMDPLNGRLRL